jgi:hypothetical protein
LRNRDRAPQFIVGVHGPPGGSLAGCVGQRYSLHLADWGAGARRTFLKNANLSVPT